MKNLIVMTIFFFSAQAISGVGGSIGGGKKGILFEYGEESMTRVVVKDTRYAVEWPTIKFGKTSIPANNVCVTDESFRTIEPLQICTEKVPVKVCTTRFILKKETEIETCRDFVPGEIVVESERTRLVYDCASYESRHFETSRILESEECIKTSYIAKRDMESEICLEYQNVSKMAPALTQVNVISKISEELIEKLNYEIPACQN